MIQIALLLLPVALAAAVWSFVLGLKALRRSRGTAERSSYQLMALLLCEPLVNAALMTMIFLGEAAWTASGMRSAALLTAPMVVLVMTLGGLAEPNPAVRGRNRWIAALAVGRWAAVVLGWLALFYSVVGPILPLVLAAAATALLWFSAVWGRNELRNNVA